MGAEAGAGRAVGAGAGPAPITTTTEARTTNRRGKDPNAMSDTVIARVTTIARRKKRPNAPWHLVAGKPYPADHGAVREHPELFATPDDYAAELLETPNVVHGVGSGYRKPERQTKAPGETSTARAPRVKDYRAALDDAGVEAPAKANLGELAKLANDNDVDVAYGYAD